MHWASEWKSEWLSRLRQRRWRPHHNAAVVLPEPPDEILAKLETLQRAFRMHNAALQELLSEGGDPMNARLYRQCLSDLRRAIIEQNVRLNVARYQQQDAEYRSERTANRNVSVWN